MRRPRARPTLAAMVVVAASGLVKTYGEGRAARRVLDGAELRVRGGEIVAVLGRSGSGKSTLLPLLGGLDRPQAGRIEVAGERVDGAGERALSDLRRRRIGFVFQFFHLLPELSGGEQQCFALPGARFKARGLVLPAEPTGNPAVEAGEAVLALLSATADE